MEKGSFQAPFSEMANLDFSQELPPIPMQDPRPLTGPRINSTTVEALLSQNEDLMARLKVTLRRLNTLETENEALQKNESNLETQNVSLTDQLLVWKEKENFWHNKIQKLDDEMRAVRARFPDFEDMERQLERYKKYHDKIRSQVKPYIQQLKSFAQNLALEIRKLNSEIEQKELRRQDLERRVQQVRNQVEEQMGLQNEQTRQLTEIYEKEKEKMSNEISELRRINTHLEARAVQLDSALLRQDELENTVIALRRAKEESDRVLQTESKSRDQELQEKRSQVIEIGCQIKDLEAKLKLAQEESERQSHRSDQMTEQLTSLRYLWTSKCEETEKLRASLQSLEKLNHELSQRLNQARKGEATL